MPETWDEVFELAEALPEGMKIGLALNPTHSFCTFITLCAHISGKEYLDEAIGVNISRRGSSIYCAGSLR